MHLDNHWIHMPLGFPLGQHALAPALWLLTVGKTNYDQIIVTVALPLQPFDITVGILVHVNHFARIWLLFSKQQHPFLNPTCRVFPTRIM